MRKTKSFQVQEEILRTLTELPQTSLASVRGGDTTEPSPEDDNDIRAHIIETG